jgi:hypothetical protein
MINTMPLAGGGRIVMILEWFSPVVTAGGVL